MRNRYIVAYDISDEKRLRRMFNKMKGYGDPIQYSVFICDLSDQEKVLLIEAILDIINQKEDRVLIANLGSNIGRGKISIESFGKAVKIPQPEVIVV
ncbi:MAG: CRISPR-associated endonuclease Cas2 [Deltaproteobacteria bacterium]|nr:CRISPR-associated endonuclease Cas2 [Deltaproteobacteria bacterium]